MADKIGSLIVSLQADLARFDSDLKRASTMAMGAMSKIEDSARAAMRTLGGLAGVVSFGALAKSAIDASDQINKLSQQTGIVAKEIDQLTVVAKLNDVEASALVKSYKALSQAMLEGTDPSSKQAKAFAELGVAIVDAQGNLRNMRDVTLDIAKVFSQAKDGPEKLAVAVGLFGKSGAEMVPVLNQMVADMERATAVQEAFGEISAQTAAAGDAINDSLTLLGEGMKRAFLPAVDSLGPAMERFTTAMMNVGKEGSALQPIMRVLFQEILPAAVETIGAMIIAANSLAKALGNLLGGLAAALVQLASGNFGAAWDTAKEAWADSGKIIADSNKEIERLMDRSREAAPAVQQVASATDSMARAAKAFAGAKSSSEVEKFGRALKTMDVPVVKFKDLVDVQQKWVDGMDDGSRALEQQTRELGLTRQEVLRLELAELDYIQTIGVVGVAQEDLAKALDRRRDAINALIVKLDELDASAAASKAAKEAEDAWKRTAENISNSLTDALLRGFESGKDFAENFVNTLKNMFKTLVLRPIIQAIVAPVAGGIAGLLPGTANAGGLNLGSIFGGGGNIFGGGGIGNLFGFGSAVNSGSALALSSIFGPSEFTAALAGDAFLPGALGATGLGTVGAGSAIGSVIGAAAPYLLAAFAIYSIFKKQRGGPKSGGSASTIPDMERFFTPSDRDAELRTVVDATQQSFDQLIDALGGKATAGFAFGFDTDPQGTASDRISALARVNGQDVFSIRDLETGRDNAATQAALELAAKQALLAALQAADLPQDIARILDSVDVGTATKESIDDILAVATALGSISDLFNSYVLEDGLTAYEDSLLGVNMALFKQIDAVNALVSEYDGSAEAATALATATQGVYASAVQAVGQINALRTQLSDLFAGSATNYRLAGMDNAEQRDYLQAEIERLTGQLQGATDASAIARFAAQIDQSQQRLWALLTPEEQMASAESFAVAAEAAGRIADERLSLALENVQTAVDEMLTGVRNVMIAAATTQQGAADTIDRASVTLKDASDAQVVAARTQLAAAQTPITINLRGTPSEVGPQ